MGSPEKGGKAGAQGGTWTPREWWGEAMVGPTWNQLSQGLWGWDSVPQPHPKAVLEGVWGRQCPAPMVQTLLSSWRCSEPLPLSYQPLTAAHNCPLPYLRSNLPSPFPEQGVKPGGRAGIWARVCCGGWLRNLGK